MGFRPFVYRLATELGLAGWVLNSSAGLVIEVEGPPAHCSRFLERLEREKPAAAVVLAREISCLAPAGFTRLRDPLQRRGRREDHQPAAGSRHLSRPASRNCSDPANRRYGYPFTNCTNCGPRYTIILDIPYDRPRTTMRSFTLVPRVPARVHRPARPPLPRPAQRLPGLRPAS